VTIQQLIMTVGTRPAAKLMILKSDPRIEVQATHDGLPLVSPMAYAEAYLEAYERESAEAAGPPMRRTLDGWQ
jgi:hypothetical protein